MAGFPHKKVHKMTYVQRTVEGMDREAILDYFCVSKDKSIYSRCQSKMRYSDWEQPSYSFETR